MLIIDTPTPIIWPYPSSDRNYLSKLSGWYWCPVLFSNGTEIQFFFCCIFHVCQSVSTYPTKSLFTWTRRARVIRSLAKSRGYAMSHTLIKGACLPQLAHLCIHTIESTDIHLKTALCKGFVRRRRQRIETWGTPSGRQQCPAKCFEFSTNYDRTIEPKWFFILTINAVKMN